MNTERCPGGQLEPIVGRLLDTATIETLPLWLRCECENAANLIAAQADEIERLQGLIAELRDTELADMACAGSDAPVEDVLGRLFDAIAQPPNAGLSGCEPTTDQETHGLSSQSARTHS